MVTEYTFKRTSKGREFATVTGENREDAKDSIRYHDICDHEDYEWSEWRLVEAIEFHEDGDDVLADEPLDDDPENEAL